VSEDAAVSAIAIANLLANDTDPNAGDILSMVGFDAVTVQGNTVVQDANGNLMLDIGGNYQSLAEGQTATDSFNYTITDAAGAAATATVDVSITGVNDAPITAADDANALQEDLGITATGNVLTNDSDIDQGTVLTVASAGVFAGLFGELTLQADGGYSYVLDNVSIGIQSLVAGQVVTETFAYQATDGIALTPSTLTITITGTNDAPVVVADTAVVQEDYGITATGNVLANDSDVDQGTVLQVVNAGIFAGQFGQLELLADGSYTYQLDNTSASVQSLAAGQTISETFAYEATDGQVSTPSTLTVSIIGSNDAPAVIADTATVREDLDITATGNVLANDSDVDQGSVLSVADAGTMQGLYGSLTLAADGSYNYTLDNASQAVQSLGRNAQVTEHFGYTVTDGIVGTPSGLDILISGSNDAPVLAASLADHDVVFNKAFSWQMPGSFTDIDAGDTLTYSATQANGTALPSWLVFDAATRTFAGQAPKQTGSIDVMVTATDVAADGSTQGSLAASDVLRITVGRGNEGVGNGEDAPPPGHDCNQNDGHGTSPGNPGSHGGDGHHANGEHEYDQHDDHDRHDRNNESHANGKKDDCIDDLIRDWFQKGNTADRHDNFAELGRGDSRIDHQANRNVAHGTSSDIKNQWEQMNARLKQHLEHSGNDDHFDTVASHGSPIMFGSGGYQGMPQLGKTEGVQMKSFAGLKEGLERLGC
jgi:VCBS repeat-containing protein